MRRRDMESPAGQRVPRAALAALVVACLLCPAVPVLASQPSAPQSGQPELVPFTQLPPSEQLPAAPLLIGAYAFVWVALLGYLWSIWTRLGRVERELDALARRLPKRPD
jgi:CcmD family protein